MTTTDIRLGYYNLMGIIYRPTEMDAGRLCGSLR